MQTFSALNCRQEVWNESCEILQGAWTRKYFVASPWEKIPPLCIQATSTTRIIPQDISRKWLEGELHCVYSSMASPPVIVSSCAYVSSWKTIWTPCSSAYPYLKVPHNCLDCLHVSLRLVMWWHSPTVRFLSHSGVRHRFDLNVFESGGKITR